jgi:GWxTD domain-containing protein
VLFPVIIPLLCAGCSGSPAVDSVNVWKSSPYQPGSPGFEIEIDQAHGDSLSGVDLYLSIPFPSLIFEKAAGGFRSRYGITARLSERYAGQLVQEVSWAETTFAEGYESTQSFEPVLIRKRVEAPPGRYRVDVTLEDLINGRKAYRAQYVAVFDTSDVRPAIGRISLTATGRDGASHPQTSFFVRARPDSTGCTVTAYNFPASSESRIEMRLFRFPTDTSIAIAPFYYSITPLPLGHRLVDFESRDTAYYAERSVRPARRDETLEFRIPPLRQGMYRIDVRAATRIPGGGDTVLSATRYYCIEGPGFPRPVTFSELIDAAVYIATNKEMSVLRSAAGPEERRQKFEELWLRFARDPVRASALIKKYYGRVEEANRLFTIEQEGWRTDRGMLYCVLGPPAEMRIERDTQVWYYDLSGNDSDNTFVFKRVIRSGEGLTVEDYFLYRQAVYEKFWNRMVARWRSGEPL